MKTIKIILLMIGAMLIMWLFTKPLQANAPLIDTPRAIAEVETVVYIEKPKTEKQIIEEYFSDIPIMIDVARCESTFRQHKEDGTLLRGTVNSQDVGALQINERYHLEDSKKIGLDVHTLVGNLAYGRYLYETQGTKPWIHSSHCWGKYREIVLK